jgi:hypothetical protein
VRRNGHLQHAHGGGDQSPRLAGQAGHARAEARVAHQHARPQVVCGLPQPARVQPAAAVGSPGRLALVEISGAALADVVRDVVAPGHGVPQVTVRIHEVGGQRQAPGQNGFCVQAGQQCLHGLGGAGRGNGCLQVLPAHAAALPLLAKPCARHQHRAARQPGQLRRGRGDRSLDLAPIRVDRDEAVQRPGRRDARAGAVDCRRHCSGRTRRRVGGVDGGVHGGSPDGR